MAKNNAFLLVGPALAGCEELHTALTERSDQLTAAGLGLPDVTHADLDRAGLEILRTHQAAGLRRRDVEGAWARVCRRADKVRGDVVIVQDALAGATPEQIALALDSLCGHRVHVVLTPAYGDEALADVWRPLVKQARVHVLAGRTLDQLVTDLQTLALHDRAERLRKRMRKLRKKQKKVATALDSVGAV